MLAAKCNRSASVQPAAGVSETSFGLPSVSVPVLSTISVSMRSITSSASAFLINTPACAPRPTPTITLIGVARPSAHGQAMISTATALRMAKAIAGAGPQMLQTTNVTIAARITAGTNQPATLSAKR